LPIGAKASGHVVGGPAEPKSSRQLTVTKPSRTVAAASAAMVVPVIVADAGEHAAHRFLEFFAATIHNKNTRTAYLHALSRFFAWCEHHQIGQLADIEPLHVAAYIEALGKDFEKPTGQAKRKGQLHRPSRPTRVSRLNASPNSDRAAAGRQHLNHHHIDSGSDRKPSRPAFGSSSLIARPTAIISVTAASVFWSGRCFVGYRLPRRSTLPTTVAALEAVLSLLLDHSIGLSQTSTVWTTSNPLKPVRRQAP
jgi:hypothetical protein